MVLWSRKQCCGFLPIPDPGSKNSNKRERLKKAPDPGSATLNSRHESGSTQKCHGSGTLYKIYILVLHLELIVILSVVEPDPAPYILLSPRNVVKKLIPTTF
jgi:hypothetical protein